MYSKSSITYPTTECREVERYVKDTFSLDCSVFIEYKCFTEGEVVVYGVCPLVDNLIKKFISELDAWYY